MIIRNIAFAGALLALPMAAQAQQVTGLYISGAVGPNLLQEKWSTNFAGTSLGNTLGSNQGVAGVGAVGYGFGNGLRAELEFDGRYNDLNTSTATATVGKFLVEAGVSGHETKYGPMVNVLYDFPVSPSVVPYVGAGIGYQWFAASSGSDQGALAYQGIAGAAFPVDGNLAVTAEYRFQTYADRNQEAFHFQQDYNHSFLIGLRYAFGAAPAMAPMPAPAPAMVAPAPVSRSYIVFFDWDKADLTVKAKQIIADAAANSTKVATTKIEVNGYTDNSGTAQYNQGLSVRRGQAVAAELVKDGVPKNEIAITGFGDTHQLVATGPNTREPQNRRVEIILK